MQLLTRLTILVGPSEQKLTTLSKSDLFIHDIQSQIPTEIHFIMSEVVDTQNYLVIV